MENLEQCFKENQENQEEKEGFNLFMGKAACATFHFPPNF